jgi:hypothetical protein
MKNFLKEINNQETITFILSDDISSNVDNITEEECRISNLILGLIGSSNDDRTIITCSLKPSELHILLIALQRLVKSIY